MMKQFVAGAVVAALTLAAGAAGAAPHPEWRKGARIDQSDWGHGQRVDYRQHHLRAPPRGYEWREVDGNYVLAAAATGLIASVIAASR